MRISSHIVFFAVFIRIPVDRMKSGAHAIIVKETVASTSKTKQISHMSFNQPRMEHSEAIPAVTEPLADISTNLPNNIGLSAIQPRKEGLNNSEVSKQDLEDNLIIAQKEHRKTQTEINILLLGETGVGKSTWINALANYLKFSSVELAAASDKLLCPIPVKFALTDDNCEGHTITFGSDANENPTASQSCTQFPKKYCFPCDDVNISVIDTPGMGDTRGIDKDNDNFMNILTFISKYDKLHAVCILLKPNQARLTVMVEYCITELLKNLHKDICRNIVFCFTSSRSEFYTPGDSMLTLKTLLKNNLVEIPLGKETVYCVDNEAIRYLTAVKTGVRMQFSEHQRSTFSQSWSKSAEAIERLLNRATTIEPHMVKNTLSINDTRRMILILSKPLADISANIQQNILAIEDQKECLKGKELRMQDLEAQLCRTTYQTKWVYLNQYVCTSPNCVKSVNIQGNEISNSYACSREAQPSHNLFRNRCCLWCCEQCGCTYSHHENMYHDTVTVEKKQFNKQIQKLVDDQQQVISVAERYLAYLEGELLDYKNEQKLITDATVQFSCFLKINSIIACNDATDKYLQYTIKIGEKNADATVRQYIKQLPCNNTKEVADLDTATCDLHVPTTDEIKTIIDKLYAMKIAGKTIQDLFTKSEAAEINVEQLNEVILEPNRPPAAAMSEI